MLKNSFLRSYTYDAQELNQRDLLLFCANIQNFFFTRGSPSTTLRDGRNRYFGLDGSTESTSGTKRVSLVELPA